MAKHIYVSHKWPQLKAATTPTDLCCSLCVSQVSRVWWVNSWGPIVEVTNSWISRVNKRTNYSKSLMADIALWISCKQTKSLSRRSNSEWNPAHIFMANQHRWATDGAEQMDLPFSWNTICWRLYALWCSQKSHQYCQPLTATNHH